MRRRRAMTCGVVLFVVLSPLLHAQLRLRPQVSGLTTPIAIVQDPYDADFPSMPQNVLKHVKVDYTVPLLSIAPLLTRLVS